MTSHVHMGSQQTFFNAGIPATCMYDTKSFNNRWNPMWLLERLRQKVSP